MSGPRPRASGEVQLERATLDLSKDDYELLDLYALYRNARAKTLEMRIKPWSRKSFAESIITEHLDALRSDLAEMFKACGPFPREEDFEDRDQLREAMEKYARRVMAWDKKNGAEE
jgi:hypothetical protein